MSRGAHPATRRVRGRATVLLAALLALPSLLAAQTTFWSLFGLQSAFCVDFLIAPDLMRQTPFRGLSAATAASATMLDPVVERAVADADSLRTWYPSSLCILQADSSQTGNDVQRHDDRPVSVVIWSLMAADSSPPPVVLFATEGRLRGAGDLSASAEVPEVSATLDVDPLTGERLVTAQIDRTRLAWAGEVLADSVTSGPVDRRWELVGTPPSWRVEFHAEPAQRQRPVGSLRVSGRGLLAAVLLRSPVRWISEYWLGGTAHFSFERGL